MTKQTDLAHIPPQILDLIHKRNILSSEDPVLYDSLFNELFPAILVKVARRKLGYLDAAVDLNDLRSPPGNRLEALSRDRDGQHSIRVNDQFRVGFIWTNEGPKDVEIIDYH